ncbi:Os01g0933400 [Oryza sativa Japonica Group]|jgi:hypothetical protein|uniref:Os01g0933400 protein n=2 Tax=Oryza sativa subsp. japonica TaxID=39947 RepID=A0A979HJB3_ORYSJ|nr:hypothetical protein OsJ_17658 [Oryza sativa Japonica Group]KAF2954164.1 hypothetical protein DAI22_01g460300 [Oryza sativa Japonica Group]KAF2954165.1 hypothetical protein DAI22_01g460300 [Oryza sativa Japonica Group]BAF07217.1 Os01g0933400 [Oryza sativa Japonica Group]BAG91594.1 unnamed protein product [Oryza sativa Japonica Group]|eukprot:NP_001045303.1 Os01g0933400 [Oryza sativa Japonica Group]
MPLCFIYISKCLLVLMLLATWLTTYKDYLAHNETELALFFFLKKLNGLDLFSYTLIYSINCIFKYTLILVSRLDTCLLKVSGLDTCSLKDFILQNSGSISAP